MSEQDAWQLSNDAAVAYERDFVPALFAQWPPIMAEIAEIGAGDRVLDVACGTGVLARGALARVGTAGAVTGLDLNDDMLAMARQMEPAVDWRRGDALDLPFTDGSFDAVVSQFALMFFPDPATALRQMWRVLAPGGRLAVAVCGPILETTGYRRLANLLRQHASEAAAAMVEGYFAMGDDTFLLRLSREAGIPDARILAREGWARFASIDDLIRIEIKGSPTAALVDAPAYERVGAAAREAMQEFCDGEGRVALRLDARIIAARKR